MLPKVDELSPREFAMKRTSVFSAAALWLVFLGGCAPAASANVTGLYLADGGATLEVLQLVEQTDGRLAGRLEFYAIKDNGEFESVSRALSGSAHDGVLVLKLDRSMETLFTSTALSGRIKGKRLELTWEGGTGSYQQSDIDERNTILERLDEQGANIRWMLRLEHLRRIVRKTGADVEVMLVHVPEVQADLAQAQTDFKTALVGIEARRKRIELLDRMNAGGADSHILNSEIHYARSQLYALTNDVRQMFNNIEGQLAAAKKPTDEVAAFCIDPVMAAQEYDFCEEITLLQEKLDSVIEAMRIEYADWQTLTDGTW